MAVLKIPRQNLLRHVETWCYKERAALLKRAAKGIDAMNARDYGHYNDQLVSYDTSDAMMALGPAPEPKYTYRNVATVLAPHVCPPRRDFSATLAAHGMPADYDVPQDCMGCEMEQCDVYLAIAVLNGEVEFGPELPRPGCRCYIDSEDGRMAFCEDCMPF